MASKKGSLNSQSMVNLLRSMQKIPPFMVSVVKLWSLGKNPPGIQYLLKNSHFTRVIWFLVILVLMSAAIFVKNIFTDWKGDLEDDHDLEDDFKAVDWVGLPLGDDLQGRAEHAGGQVVHCWTLFFCWSSQRARDQIVSVREALKMNKAAWQGRRKKRTLSTLNQGPDFCQLHFSRTCKEAEKSLV